MADDKTRHRCHSGGPPVADVHELGDGRISYARSAPANTGEQRQSPYLQLKH